MMESFALYLLKSALWLSGFALVYAVFLRNERFFNLKRYFLLLGLIASIIFPLISVRYNVEMPAPSVLALADYATNSAPDPDKSYQFSFMHVLLITYCTGLILLVFKLISQFKSVYRIIKNSSVQKEGPASLICTDRVRSPFSFFNYIFLKPSLKGKEKEMIVNHEMVHVNQKHWIDLIFSELVRLIQWINPVVWAYASFIRQNNEYIADEAALKQISDPAIYQATLLNQLFDSPVINLFNSFSYSLNKKRFEMMKKTIRSPYRKIRVLFVLPVFALLMYAFAEETYIYSAQTDDTVVETQARELQDKLSGVVYNSDGNAIPGAAVIITGTTSGTITDTEGNFLLSGVPGDASITVAAPGFKSRTVKVNNNSELTVTLIGEDEEILPPPPPPPPPVPDTSEVIPPLVYIDGVSVPYSEIEKIDPEDIILMRGLNGESAVERYGSEAKDGIIEILTKRDSAPQSSRSSDQESSEIKIKKTEPASSVTVRSADGNTPLYIVDGKITDEINDIDVDDIQQITVLKDSTATELYGEEAKDGVIIIDTKSETRKK